VSVLGVDAVALVAVLGCGVVGRVDRRKQAHQFDNI
jgi:hypothetical protein